MVFRYKIDKENEVNLEKLKSMDGVEDITLKDNVLVIKGDVESKEIEKSISSPTHYTFFDIKAEIDCPNCAKKVERALSALPSTAYVDFNFQKGRLKIISSLALDEIKKEAEKAEDEIVFPEEKKYNRYSFSVSIDCADCAREVEEGLAKREDVKEVSIDFPKAKMTILTSMTRDEVKEKAKEIEEDMEFLDGEPVRLVFSVSLDNKDNARRIERELRNKEGVKKVRYDYRKGKLHVYSSLSEKEIMKEAKAIESSIVFHSSMTEERSDYSIFRVIVSILLLIIGKVTSMPILSVLAYVISGYDVLWKALKNTAKGKVFDENFLMALATIAALAVKNQEEAAAVMIFYQVGEYFQHKATEKSRESIGKLLDLSTDSVSVKVDGEWKEMDPEEVEISDVFMVKAGEKVALDGEIIEGEGFIDTRALTGESVPVKVKKGDRILSGSVNGESTLLVKATSLYRDSTATKIMKMVEEGEGRKAESEKFITTFSRYYTPAVSCMALLLALILPLFGLSWKDSIYRAAMLLVISCPCALVLSVPLTYFASMGAFAKNGILVKGDDAIQRLKKLDTVALDKTGTLTEGVFSIQSIENLSVPLDHLLTVAKAIERESTHPIATAIMAKDGGKEVMAEKVVNISGIGMEGIVEGKKVRIGSIRIAQNLPILDKEGTHIYVTEEDKLIGIFVISDRIRNNAASALASLRKEGVKKIFILSGDRKERVKATAEALSMDGYYGELLPDEKLLTLDKLKKDGVTAYCGDGINDAPALKRSDVGIAMGGVGSHSAIEAASVVIMDDDISKLPLSIRMARRTETIVKENIIFSLSVKAIVFILASFGLSNMWLAVIADTGVSLIAVANALRALYFRKK